MSQQVRFGDWSFCPDSYVLERSGVSVVLEPRVARLLECFLANPGELLTHQQLTIAVWDGRVVSVDAIRRAVSSLRHALAADGTDKCITTVLKRGYIAHFPPPTITAPQPPSGLHRLARARPVLLLGILLIVLVLVAFGAWMSRSVIMDDPAITTLKPPRGEGKY
ncbi:winged helix-turn-helix domain-containing protein [Kineobactrum sediminis]|nr:winged helix-turn-helix domain-containing protein [Kineobactrum sediminis]